MEHYPWALYKYLVYVSDISASQLLVIDSIYIHLISSQANGFRSVLPYSLVLFSKDTITDY